MNYFVYDCMNLVGLTRHPGLLTILLPTHDVFLLVCSFQAAYYYRILRDTFSFPLRLLEPPHASLLTCCKVTHLLLTNISCLPLPAIRIKAYIYYPLLGLLLQTIGGLVGTSYQADPLTCWWVQHL